MEKINKVTIHIFRHGQTSWNAEKRFQGQADIPLNDHGKSEAVILAHWLGQHHKKIEALYTSDLIRAYDTAQIVSEHLGIPPQIDSRLREIHMGQGQGLLVDEIHSSFGKEFLEGWYSIDKKYLPLSFPDGETKAEHLQRILHFFEEIFNQTSLETLAVSTHGGALKRLVHHIIGYDQPSIPIPNCCCYTLFYDKEKKEWSKEYQYWAP